VEKANQGRVTVSMGLVEYKEEYDIISMIRYADRAMYIARTRVEIGSMCIRIEGSERKPAGRNG